MLLKEAIVPFRENRQELRTILDHISDGILFIDHTGAVRFLNRSLADMFALQEDISGQKIFSFLPEHPLKDGIFRAEMGFSGLSCWERNNCPESSTCPGRSSRWCRCWILHSCSSLSDGKNGSCIDCQQFRSVKRFLERPKEIEAGDRTISVLSSFIEYKDREEIWEVILFRDVTAEKLDAVIKLAGAAAHELRQPLQIITSCISVLNDRLSGNGEVKENFDTIYGNCYRMNDIIENITRITRYKTKKYVMNQVILDIERSAQETRESED